MKRKSPYGLNHRAGHGLLLEPFRAAGIVWFRDYAFNRSWLERAKGDKSQFLRPVGRSRHHQDVSGRGGHVDALHDGRDSPTVGRRRRGRGRCSSGPGAGLPPGVGLIWGFPIFSIGNWTTNARWMERCAARRRFHSRQMCDGPFFRAPELCRRRPVWPNGPRHRRIRRTC